MAAPALTLSELPDPLQVPAAPEWARMTLDQRMDFTERASEVLREERLVSPVGRPHHRTCADVYSTLHDHYARTGRRVFLADDLPVLYPGQRMFSPDLLAVLDVEDRGAEETRYAWDVLAEGRGLDLVIEVVARGSRMKDLYENVRWYAQLGIQEYFVYDIERQRLYGHRLEEGETRYRTIPMRSGELESEVLELGLAVVDGHLRFFYGGAQVPESRELLTRANRMLESLQERVLAEAARAEAEAARAEAEAARAEAEAARAESEGARAESEAARAAAESLARIEAEKRVATLLAELERLRQG